MIGDALHPCLILLIGGALLPLLRGRWQQIFMLFLPVFGLVNLWSLGPGPLCVCSTGLDPRMA